MAMAMTRPAKGTYDKQETGGVNKERESYGDLPAKGEGVQEWPSYTGKPHRTGGGTKSSGGSKKSGY